MFVIFSPSIDLYDLAPTSTCQETYYFHLPIIHAQSTMIHLHTQFCWNNQQTHK